MINEDQVLESPGVDMAFAAHGWPSIEREGWNCQKVCVWRCWFIPGEDYRAERTCVLARADSRPYCGSERDLSAYTGDSVEKNQRYGVEGYVCDLYEGR